MSTISVRENLERIRNAEDRFKKELEEIEKRGVEIKEELLRLEGCWITFKGFQEAGLETIGIKKEDKQCETSHQNKTEEPEEGEIVQPHSHQHNSKPPNPNWVKEFHHLR